MVLGGSCWFLVVIRNWLWFLVFLVVHGGSKWFLLVLSGSWWFLVVFLCFLGGFFVGSL